MSPQPSNVARARTFVAEALQRLSIPKEAEELARLAVSELVTNAIVHAATPVVVRVRRDTDGVWVGVTDLDERLPVLKNPGPESTGNRGLAIVAAVARQWGVDRQFSRPGKTVWFTLSFEG